MTKRLGSNIYIGNRRKLDRIFNALIGRITWVGSDDLPATNTATGTRKSLDPSTADRGVNEVDQWTRSGIPMISSLAAATNLVDTDLTNWGNNLYNSDNGDYTYNVAFPALEYATNFQYTGLAANPYTVKLQAKLISGNPANVIVRLQEWGGSYSNFATESLSALSDEWTDIIPSGISGAYTSQALIIYNTTDEHACTISVRSVRCVNSTAPAAPFPDGSAAGASVGVDLVTCTMPSLTEGTIVQAAIPDGWNLTPLDTYTRLFKATDLQCYTNPFGTPVSEPSLVGATTLGCDSQIVAGLNILSYDWSGVDIGLRCGDNSRLTSVDANVPSGTLYIGNTNTISRPFHGALVTGIVPWVLSDAEYEILRVGLQNLFGGQVLQ